MQAGIAAKRKYRIDRERTIDFMGEAARVYATPMLVRDIEVTCREFLLEHLDAGEDSVGARVEIDSAPGRGTRVVVVFPASMWAMMPMFR